MARKQNCQLEGSEKRDHFGDEPLPFPNYPLKGNISGTVGKEGKHV